jgi:phytoene dehydrogenase-like protein
MRAGEYLFTNLDRIRQVLHEFMHSVPSVAIKNKMGEFVDEFSSFCGVDLTFEKIWDMNGFQVTDVIYDSEHIKTLVQAFGWIGGMPPIHPTIGSLGTSVLGPLSGPVFPVHQCRGGSHALSHSLVKAATACGVTILPCCPVEKIIVENGEAKGVILSGKAIFSNEKIFARKIISNLTLVPTFEMVGNENIESELAERINNFVYSEQNIFCMNFALDGAPQFASADFDDGIQRCFMGYFGGKDSKEFERFNHDLINGIIHETHMANWFVPTLADPTQAPEGSHTAVIWQDIPPAPKAWKNGPLNGMDCWDDIKYEMADSITDEFEKYAPGFKKLINERIIYTPVDIERNNPAAVMGNWVGGSVIPEQFFMNRPVKGVLKGGASRTFIGNLYLSNSIHPFGASWLCSGYIAACEVAEDVGVREQDWWKSQSFDWYHANIDKIPQNLGVR